jgi:LysR family glycine cleavage system transcriptional activator
MRLPPLNAVKAFEAAGRLENFSKAATELNVTPGAISRQVKTLEEHLGVRLFGRIGKQVQITPVGQRYLRDVQQALSFLEAGTRSVKQEREVKPLHIWGSRFFIRLWLLPRLPDFQRRFPDQKVQITTVRPEEPLPDEFDVAIKAGSGEWSGMQAELLLRRVVTPVCSPDYLRIAPALTTPADLAQHTLLDTSSAATDWDSWAAATGIGSLAKARRVTFTSADLSFSAALDGLGVVLGRRGFVEAELKKGSLLAPFDSAVEVGDSFYLIHRDDDPVPRRVRRFCQWIALQIADPHHV